MPHLRDEFDSYGAFLEQAQKPGLWGESAHMASNDPNFKEDFYKTPNWESMMQLARDGWPEGRAKLQERMQEVLSLKPQARIAAWSYDVAGAFPDVPRFIAGAPDCMVNMGDTTVAMRPIVRVLANRGARANVPAGYVNNWGAALLACIDRLENDGFSVELTITTFAKSSWDIDTHALRFIAKRAGEQLELDRIAFVLLHPSFHRRLVFALREQHTELEKPFYNYGVTQNLPKDDIEPGTIYIPYVTSEAPWHDAKASVEYVEKLFECAGED